MNRELDNWQTRSVKDMRIEDMIDRTIEWEQSEARKQRRRNVAEAIGALAVLLLMAVLAWLFLAMTPPQASAECEALREEIEATSGK